jgi:hypothetical protein
MVAKSGNLEVGSEKLEEGDLDYVLEVRNLRMSFLRMNYRL